MVTIPRYVFYVYLMLISIFSFFSQKVFSIHFSDMYFFGDSLSDTGNYPAGDYDKWKYHNLPPAPIINDGRPLWNQLLTSDYGIKLVPRGYNYLHLDFDEQGRIKLNPLPEGANNYAGVASPSKMVIPQILTLLQDKGILPDNFFKDEMTYFEFEAALFENPNTEANFAKGILISDSDKKVKTEEILEHIINSSNKLDPNALYSVWIGANDVFDDQICMEEGNPEKHKIRPDKSVDNIVKGIKLLNAAGARQIMVSNIPDLTKVPRKTFKNGKLSETEPGDPKNSTIINRLLLAEIQALKFPVLLIDVESLLNDMIKDPQSFGLENITHGFHKDNKLSGDAPIDENLNPETTLSYDGFHPSAVVHGLFKDYIKHIINAPMLAHSMLLAHKGTTNHIHQGMQPYLTKTKEKFAPFFFTNAGVYEPSTKFDNPTRADNQTITVGVASNFAPNLTAGLAISAYHTENDVKSPNASFTTKGGALSAGFGFEHKYMFADVIFQIGTLYYDTSRHIDIGPKHLTAAGQTSGLYTGSFSQTGAYVFNNDVIKVGPFLEVNHYRVRIDGFEENNAEASNLVYHKQFLENLDTGIGLRLIGNIANFYDNTVFTIETKAAAHKNWIENPFPIEYHQKTLPGTRAQFRVPTNRFYFYKVSVNFCVTHLTNKISALLGFSASNGNGLHNQMIHAGIKVPLA